MTRARALRRTRTTAAASALLALVALVVATGCEATVVNRTNAARTQASVAALATSSHLTTQARAHSQAMCDAGATSPTDDLDAAYGGEGADGLDELVGSAVLDPGIADAGARNGAATDAIWAGWADEPTLVDPVWESIGVGEVECADGRLYATLVLRDDIPGIEQPADTSQIELISSVTQDGYEIQFFRNRAYGCSISGDQTFIIATPVGQSATSTRPLWVKMHGGGVGYFDPSGTPIPAGNKAQEGRSSLIGRIDDGLMARIGSEPDGYRIVAVSMCSHDLYSGTNTPDPNNPNVLVDGSPRTTNGLLATKAAITHATALYPTDDVFLHGGSAGSAGSLRVAWAMELEGDPPAGIVADAGVMNIAWEAAQLGSDLPCGRSEEAATIVPLRFHPSLRTWENQPDMVVSSGRTDVPILHAWSSGDPNVCGTTPMGCALRDGTTVTMGSADCVHEPLRKAIDDLGPGSGSMNMRVCVDNPSLPGACDKHVVTTTGTLLNTDPAFPTDHVGVALDWVRDRRADD